MLLLGNFFIQFIQTIYIVRELFSMKHFLLSAPDIIQQA